MYFRYQKFEEIITLLNNDMFNERFIIYIHVLSSYSLLLKIIIIKKKFFVIFFKNLCYIKNCSFKIHMNLHQQLNEETKLLEEVKEKSKTFNSRKLIDIIFSGVVVAPLIIFYWSSTWDLFYYYIPEENYIIGAVITFIVTNIIILSIYLTQDFLQKYHDKLTNGSFMRYAFFYVLSISYVGQWRSLYDLYGKDKIFFYALLNILGS